MHAPVWKFRPTKGREVTFSGAYSACGPSSELFRRAKEYRGTSLLRASEPGGWRLTIDRWNSLAEGLSGEEEFAGAFEEDL